MSTPPLRAFPWSRVLAVAALALWVVSLTQVAFLLYVGERNVYGYELLLAGGFGVLGGYFAWLANVFFLVGLVRVLSGHVPMKTAFLAWLLSLDTFRVSEYLLDEAGGKSPIVGYGWGVVLWLLAMCVLLAAVGARSRETSRNPRRRTLGDTLFPLGLALTVLTIGIAGGWAWHDRNAAGEASRLGGIAFTRGPVCAAPMPRVTAPLQSMSGPLEIVIDQGLARDLPLGQVETLLHWGVPSVRMDGMDQSRAPDGSRQSVPATGEAGARLVAGRAPDGSIHARLVEAGTGRVVFDQVWQAQLRDGPRTYYCPEFDVLRSEEGSPRDLLVRGLGMNTIPNVRPSRQLDTRLARIEGMMLPPPVGKDYQRIRALADSHANARAQEQGVSDHARYNINCPGNLGLRTQPGANTQLDDPPFMIGAVAHYPGLRYRHALCQGDSAFLSLGSDSGDVYYLNVQKRDLRTFGLRWRGIVSVPVTNVGNEGLVLYAVEETPQGTNFVLFDDRSGNAVVVQADMGIERR